MCNHYDGTTIALWSSIGGKTTMTTRTSRPTATTTNTHAFRFERNSTTGMWDVCPANSTTVVASFALRGDARESAQMRANASHYVARMFA